MVPNSVSINSGVPSGEELRYEGEGNEGSEERSTNALSQGAEDESDDSVTVFEWNLRELLPGFQGGTDSEAQEQAKGPRKSKRPKKPPSRFTEEAGYLTEPPKSTKKKGAGADGAKASDEARTKMEERTSAIRRSLEFLGTSVEEQGSAQTSDVGHESLTG